MDEKSARDMDNSCERDREMNGLRQRWTEKEIDGYRERQRNRCKNNRKKRKIERKETN